VRKKGRKINKKVEREFLLLHLELVLLCFNFYDNGIFIIFISISRIHKRRKNTWHEKMRKTREKK
jgi:hypothetical protein